MMNSKKSRPLKTALFVALLSATLYAAIDFNPGYMPTVTLAPYVLKNADLSTANNHAYRPWFENGAWQGDLIEYDLAIDGTRTTDASVGSNPPVAGSNNWLARAAFAARENPSGDGQTFTTYWQDGTNGRNIFTVGSSGTQADFLWSNLSDAQKTALDPAAFALGTNNPYDSPILNFVRGDRSNERGQGGNYRNRYSLLGDIVNSSPVYIGAARETFTTSGYPLFRDSVKNRDGRIAVGANDGMLHVFDEDDGSEVYAYVPSMLLGKLAALKTVPYRHTHYVDGQLTVASANNGGTWISVLAGSTGVGAKGLYALNVTDPDMSSGKVLFEKTGADIGYILGRPRIARKNDGKWYIFTGNGLNSTNGVAKLLMFELNGSTYTQTELSTGASGGLSAPVLVDTNKDFKADFALAGDTNGDMWKFYLGSSPPAINPVKIFDGSPDRPILTAPAVTAHPSSGFMVVWGTGSSLSLAEATNTSYPSQAIYGVWDKAIGDVMVTQVMLEKANVDFSGNTETIRYIETNNALDYTCAANDATCTKGWVVVLPNTGERALGPVQVRAGRISILSSTPLGTNSASTDLVGDSWLISLSYFTGGDDSEVVFNLNGDSLKNDLDKVDVGSGGTSDLRPPVALHLGDGNISQPVIARLTGGTDVMYINGLRMPLPYPDPVDGPFLTGHLDVHTDSPNSSPNVGGSIAPNSRNKHSELYNIDTSDGLGRGVNGHFHEYDTVNNVHYVDLFELEPRRGLSSAAAVLTSSSAPCDTTTDNGKEIEVGGKCLQAVEGELNRAYDTLQTDADGNADAKESEVYERTQSTPLPATDKFILVVANGDLTPAAKLQIGCRTWDIKDYEDMMSDQLEAGTNPDDLDDTVNGVTAAGTLVFTLDEIESGSADSATCPDDSQNPTIRLHFTARDILDGAIHGTRAQCVLGLHDYRDPVDYWDHEVLCHAPNHLYGESVSCSGITDPGAAYIENPADNLHITDIPSQEGKGFRWRNGALTIQLLKVNNGSNAAEYTLQPAADLPTKGSNRFGGTYAQAFSAAKVMGKWVLSDNEGPNESGLLYESSLYWHFGDFANGIQRGAPASIPCYGDPSWGSAFTQETRGLTLGQYKKLYEDIDVTLLALYDAAVLALEAALAGTDQAAIDAALLTLAELLQDADLAWYHKYRDYAPGNVAEQHLREIDKNKVPPPGGGGGSSTDDGIPVDVVNLDDLDTETIGPNFKAGRRTWIDLRL